jgi:hypothetical protein
MNLAGKTYLILALFLFIPYDRPAGQERLRQAEKAIVSDEIRGWRARGNET